MFSEILEEPIALQRTMSGVAGDCRRIASELTRDGLGLVYFSGSGTSYHAALASQYLLSSASRTPTNSIPASEFESWVRTTPSRGSVLVAISQSGESVDALSAVKTAKSRGIRTVAVTNAADSPLCKSSDFALVTDAGPEGAVTATKTYVSCLLAAYLFTIDLIDGAGSYAGSQEDLSTLRRELYESPSIVQQTIRMSNGEALSMADRFKAVSLFFLLGRGASYATALEGALKLKESCNVMAEGHAAREFLHGPMQLVDDNTPLIVVSTRSDYESLEPLAESFRRLGAPIVWVSNLQVNEHRRGQLDVAAGLSEALSPLAFIVPIQLFAYHSAVSRGLDPDRPTKLTKVVR